MVTPFYHPFVGGTENLIENISIRLNKIGATTDIMTFNYKFTPRGVSTNWKKSVIHINGLRVIEIPALSWFPFPRLRPPVNFRVNLIPGWFTNEFNNYDIIHFHSDIDLSFPLFSYYVKKPKILHCHSLDVTYRFYKKNLLAGHIFRNVANVYLAMSGSIRDLLINLSVPRKKITVIPNCIDTEEFKPSEQPRINNLLLYVGRLEEKKGVHVLLESLSHLSKSAQLVIIGRPMNSAYLERILSSINKVNSETTHKAIYLGVLRREELIKWYQRASVFVCPSLSEPFGIVNLEALSCETPVVASNVGGIPEIVLDDHNGTLVRPNDAVQLANALQFLLDTRKTRQKYGKKGRAWILKRFSSEVVVEKLCMLYENLLAR